MSLTEFFTKKQSLLTWVFLFLFNCICVCTHSTDRKNFTGNDYTFCYGSFSVSLFDGGKSEQIRYSSNGTILKKILGEWTAYGSTMDIPGQTIKIVFEGDDYEYSYTLIRDGFGKPSVLIDGQGRRYTLCKKSPNTDSQENNSSSFGPPSEFTGTFSSTDKSVKIIVTYKGNNEYSAMIFKNGKKVSFKNSCGVGSEYKGEEVQTYISFIRGVIFYLSVNNCEKQIKFSVEYSTSKYDPGLVLKTDETTLLNNGEKKYKLVRIK